MRNRIWLGSADCSKLTLAEDVRDRELLELDGSFSILEEREDEILLACDCIRSIPLFYTVMEEEVIISDDAAVIHEYTKAPLDRSNVEEFLSTGYVTGRETLFRKIYQINPGEIIIIQKSGMISRHFYYELRYTGLMDETEEKLLILWDECLKKVFRDLIKRLSGRCALIPLSGGCDSRTVAVMFKRLGYEKVTCFSYSRKEGREAAIGKRVADYLGFPWHFIEYSEESWRAFYSSGDYPGFLRYSCKGSGIGCVQALPAMLELKRRRLVPKDAVVIPGHALDMEAGSHIPLMKDQDIWSREQFIRRIETDHYNLRRSSQIAVSADRKWSADIPFQLNRRDLTEEYQYWEWRNRQAKFIGNDVRAYEYAGFDWEMPFWDRRICHFWSDVPDELLQGRYLQYRYMEKMIDPLAGVQSCYPKQTGDAGRLKMRLKKLLPFLTMVKRIYSALRQKKINGNAFYDHLGRREYVKYLIRYGTSFSINTLVAEASIRELKKENEAGGK